MKYKVAVFGSAAAIWWICIGEPYLAIATGCVAGWVLAGDE